METIMFAVGALTMVLLAVASLAVYSTVMVLKLKKESYIDRTEIWRQVHENHQIVFRKIEDIENNLRTEMRLGEQELNLRQDQITEHVDRLEQTIYEHVNQLGRSVDRRFDKMLSSFLSQEYDYQAKHSKEIIKG
jgi:hypothetical protein